MTTYRIEYDTSAGPEDAEAGRVWDVVRRDEFGATFTVSTGSFEADAKLIVAALEFREEVELWYVKGIAGTYFVNKDQAEHACRSVFHDESPEQQYARIFFRRFYREVA